jgi:hypothetical protein
MYLRANKRIKDGKEHRYWSVEESRRLRTGRVVQRRVLYLGEINDSQQAAWRKTLEVFDEAEQRARTLSLFPEDRAIPADALDGVQVKLREMELRRPRAFGNYWLGCELWRQLGLGVFWEGQLGGGREEVPWAKVLELPVVSRLVSPGSEFRLHRQGFDQSAMGDLLGSGFAVAEKDRLYRCLDRIVEHKAALFDHLRQRWQDLFQARFDILLYDLTSTYIEGEGEEIPKAQYGYSRDHRFDCRQVVIALVVTPEGFPLAYEVMEGNTSDRTTLRGFLAKIEAQYGQARRVWVMDRGIPTEEVLEEMRTSGREIFYLVGTPRGKIQQYEQKWLELPWQKVRESVEVKLFAEEGELYVLAKSAGRRAKERAIRRRKLVGLLKSLRKLRRNAPARDQLLLRIGAAKKQAGRAFGFLSLRLPQEGEEVSQTFTFQLDKEKLRKAELRDGHYLLRSNLVSGNPSVLWECYIQLTQVEAAFRTLKSELGLRPIYHQVEKRVEAHVFVAFLAYALSVTLKQRLVALAPGLTPRAVLEKLATLQMLDVCLPTTDGRWLIMPRYTQPEAEQMLMLHQLHLSLPSQPPPRIKPAESAPTTTVQLKM